MSKKRKLEIEKAKLEVLKESLAKIGDIGKAVFSSPTGVLLVFLFAGKLFEMKLNKEGDYENSGVIAGMNSALQTALVASFTSDLLIEIFKNISGVIISRGGG